MDGLGFDWPITSELLAPYYDKAETFIGVTGTKENIRSAPDGIFQTPAALRAHDTLVQRSCAKLGIRAVPGRQAVITRPTNGRPSTACAPARTTPRATTAVSADVPARRLRATRRATSKTARR